MKRIISSLVVSSLFFSHISANAQVIERSRIPFTNFTAPLPVAPFGTSSYPMPSITFWHTVAKLWGYGSPFGTVIPSIPFLADDNKGAPRNCPGNTWNKHLGTDYAAPAGTYVYAMTDGIVRRVGGFTGIGDYYVVVESGDMEKWTTLCGHLNKPSFVNGTELTIPIKKGAIIGTLYDYREGGDIPHLHLGIRLAPYDKNGGVNSFTRGFACIDAVNQNSQYKFTSPEALKYYTQYYWRLYTKINLI